MNQDNTTSESDKINIIESLQKIWENRHLIVIIMLLSSTIGITVALTSKNIFTAFSTFIPKSEDQAAIGGNLSGLASLAGINLGSLQSSQSGIPLQLYPRLINSNPFVESLLKLLIPYNGTYISFKDYLTIPADDGSLLKIMKSPLTLISLIKLSFSPKEEPLKNHQNLGIQKLTREEESIYNTVKEDIISLEIDDKEGFVTLSVNLEHPETAAFLAKKVQILLQKEIINFKIKSAQDQLTFTEKLYEEKKIKFEVLQDKLAQYEDQNLNISSGTFQNTVNRLEAEVSISGSIYEEIAKQVEQARIQVVKNTPIFTIIDPVVIPNSKTNPKKSLVVISWALLGFVLGISYILMKDPLSNIRDQILNIK